jgi:hypothetical protein
VVVEFREEFASGELSTSFAFTRRKATSAAIGEGAEENLGNRRKRHCCVYCGRVERVLGQN